MKVKIKHFSKNAIIYLERNTNLNEFYIVKKGEIQIVRSHPIKGEIEDIKSEGYIFGIKQCITGITEDERVKAISDCDIICIEKNRITELYKNSPKVIMKILSEYSEILRNLDNDLLKHDLLLNLMIREELILDISRQYIESNDKKKAAHLLKSFLSENSEHHTVVEKAKKILQGLPDVELPDNSDLVINKTFSQDQVIFVEMELGNSIYVIKSGRVKITNIRKGKEILIAVLGEGSIFGEMSILNNKPRNATAVAETKCEVTVINKRSINNLPATLFYKILEHLTHRIWMTEQTLICLDLVNPVARAYFYLTSKVKQNMRNMEDESKSTFLYQSTKDELYDMIDLSKDERKNMEDFEKDPNIMIYETGIKIKNIKNLYDKNSFYLSRSLISMNKS